MNGRAIGQKDIGAGLLYLTLGIAGLWLGAGYAFGAAGRMGPGYFPRVISGLLVVFGLLSLLRGGFRSTSVIEAVNLKGITLITLSVVGFGVLLKPAGLPLALAFQILTSAAASSRFAFDLRALLGMLALIAFCVLVFVTGLGLPMRLLGTWFAV